MTTRHHLTIAIVALSLLAVACDDGEPSANSPATSETRPSTTPRSTAAVSTEAPTTSAATTTEAPPTTPPPTTAVPTTPPTIAVDSWEAILEELARRRVALYAAPDLSRIGDYCMPGTDCALGLETQFSDYIARGEHIEGQQPFDVVEIVQASFDGPSPAESTIAQVLFTIAPENPPPARIVDATGNVVDELSVTTTKTRGRFTLAKSDDPVLPWRVVLIENLGPVP